MHFPAVQIPTIFNKFTSSRYFEITLYERHVFAHFIRFLSIYLCSIVYYFLVVYMFNVSDICVVTHLYLEINL